MDLAGLIAELLEEHGGVGISAGVVAADGSVEFASGGTRGGGLGPVEVDTVFEAASLTKPLFALGVMALLDAGELELDRPLVDYVPESYCDDARAASITARIVLSHATGFPNWRDDRPLYMRWAPGTRWGYAGEGYAYLHQVVERVTGLRLEQYLADAVFAPLGMKRSSLVWRDDYDDCVAFGHDPDGIMQPRAAGRDWKAAAGGLYTTAPDYMRFLVHCLANEQRMFEPQIRIDDALGWSLGWGIEEADGARSVWQWGNNPGYKNFVLGSPSDGRGVVVFTNSDLGVPLYRELVQRLLPGPHPSLTTGDRPRWMLALARRPVDLQPRLDDADVRAVLEVLAWRGEAGEVDRISDRYRDSDARLLGFVVEKSWESQTVAPGTAVGCIGVERVNTETAEITALAVLPEWRRRGLGRSLIFGTCEYLGLRAVEAETSADAVDFYRATGFTVESLGEKYPGTERFRCRLDLPPI